MNRFPHPYSYCRDMLKVTLNKYTLGKKKTLDKPIKSQYASLVVIYILASVCVNIVQIILVTIPHELTLVSIIFSSL